MITEHQRALRQQLFDAATRRADERRRRRAWKRKLVSAGVVCAVAIAVTGVGIALNADVASARVFVVTEEGDSIVVSVEGAIDNPDQATRELQEYGIDAKMIARPAPPSLEGRLVGGFSRSGTMDLESDGTRVVRFRIPKSHNGEIGLEYGRKAQPDELYLASEPPPDCDEFSGLPLTDRRTAEIRSRYGPHVVWQEVGESVQTGVLEEEIAPNAIIVTILPWSSDTVMLGVTDGSQPPPGSEC